MSPPTKSAATAPPAGGQGQAGQGQGQVINLTTLNPMQLQQLKQTIEQELNFYQEAIMQLKDVQIKMTESGNCIKLLDKDKKDMLVPLTGSMFVMGENEDPNNVLIDIGTGYFVEKTLEEAEDYFKRKVEFLSTQIERVQAVGREKSSVRSAIMEVLEAKLIANGSIKKAKS